MKTQTTEELKEMERLIKKSPFHISQLMDGLAAIARDLKKKEKEKANDRPLRKSG